MSKGRQILSLSKGFTIVEILIVAPIVILVIGVFVTAVVNMTGDVLATRASNVLSYNIQDALNRIEQDVDSSSGYLATNNITLTSPQGYDDSTASFKNVGANGTMLILNTYATTSNPLNSTSIVYTPSPNLCGSNLVSQNPPVMMNIIYFVKNGTLWRRVVAPSNYATIGCSVPWQQPSCAAGTSGGPFCEAQDTRLVDGIVPGTGFSVGYYTSASSTTANSTASDSGQSDSARQAALQSTNTASVTINAASTVAGRNVSQSGTMRATPNSITPSTSDIVTNGLALNLDAGNLASYPGSGTIWTDLSGNGNNGTLNGGVTYNPANGGVMAFDGASGYVNIPNSSSILPSTGNISTLSCFKALATGVDGGSIILNKESEYELSAGGGNIDYAFRPNWAWVGATSFNVSQFYCVAVTYDQSYQRMYINGTQVYSAPLSGAIGNLFSNDLRIGARGAPGLAGAFFNGQIATVQIYNRALSAAEVQQNFNAFSSRYNYQYVKALVVAGGGGGGGSTGGGGGGGGVIYSPSTAILSGTSYSIVIGAGGAISGNQSQGKNGSNSTFNGLAAIGGGGGGYSAGGTSGASGLNGGSGGGGQNYYGSYISGIGTSGQGYNGGLLGISAGSGGGGAGGNGGVGATANAGGVGGVGIANSISGSSVYYGGGGGGASGGGGGNGGGGNSADVGSNGTPNTGGGGGGGWSYASGNGGAGGSGVVIISYPTGSLNINVTGTVATTTSNGNTIQKFTGNGTFTVN